MDGRRGQKRNLRGYSLLDSSFYNMVNDIGITSLLALHIHVIIPLVSPNIFMALVLT